MRFKKLDWRAEGDSRVIRKFPILPRTISGETRWLEWCLIRQTLSKRFNTATGSTCLEWVDIEWVD